MVTTQTSFQIKLEKGKIGEDIVRKKLEEKGWIVYCPFTTDKPHAFDMLATLNKERCIALDVKAKARMNKFPATGINIEHYEQYKRFGEKHLMPFWIVFVDEQTNEIYGDTIENLSKECVINNINYPFIMKTKFGKDIILWPIDNMHKFGNISQDESNNLKKFNTRSHEYQLNV